jgi:DNA-directed RNA polymerase subunit RPC12/RpoP
VGASHPTVGKVRQALEAEAEASGKNFQMPEERVVQRGDQTYTYKPPEHETERESPYLKVWEIERGIRSYLDRVFGSTTMGFSAKDDDTVAQEQRQYLIKLRREERHDELYEHISGSFREGDIVQAVNNVIEQLRQEIERHRERQRSQAEPAPDTPQSATQSSTSPDEPPRLAEVIRERLIEGDVEGFVEALREAELDDYYTPPTPPDFHNALTTIFGSGSDAYVDPSQRRTATRCLYDAIAAGAGGEDSAPEKAQATDAAACPECGGRVIHISANGKPARDVCMECGTVIEIKEETV